MTFHHSNARRHLFRRLAALGASCAGVTPSLADTVAVDGVTRILVGFTPGASTDAIARRVSQNITGRYAPAVFVENKSGAGGRLAVDALKQSKPDGRTLLMSPTSLLTLIPYTTQVSYDPFADLVPVTPAARYDLGLGVGPSVPASVRTVAQLIKYMKDTPKAANYASPAPGTTPHFLGFKIARDSDTAMQHIGYRGIQPAILALKSGEVGCLYCPLGDLLPFTADGSVRILASSGAKRSQFTPGVMTFQEAGFPDAVLTESYGWFVPRGSSRSLVDTANRALRTAMEAPSYLKQIHDLGLEPFISSAADYASFVASENERWKANVRATNFNLES